MSRILATNPIRGSLVAPLQDPRVLRAFLLLLQPLLHRSEFRRELGVVREIARLRRIGLEIVELESRAVDVRIDAAVSIVRVLALAELRLPGGGRPAY